MAKKKHELDGALQAINLLELSINHQGKKLPENPVFNFEIKVELNINKEKDLIIIFTKIDITSKDKKTVYGSIVTACSFRIEKVNQHLVENKAGQESLPKEVADILTSIAISTTRGVMFSEFKGSFLHNAILPIVDPTAFSSANN